MTEVLAKRIFGTSLAFLLAAALFLYGWSVERFHLWPHDLMQSIHSAASSIKRFGKIIPDGRRVPANPDFSRQTFTVHDPDRMIDGNYVFVGWDDQASSYAAWLYDNQGKRLHTWLLNYADFADDADTNVPGPHGFQVLRDGSVIANFDKGNTMVRLDACSKPLWTSLGTYHHSIAVADDGSMWTWRGEDGTAYGNYQYLHQFDPDTGKTLKEIGLVEDIIKPTGQASIAFGTGPDYPFKKFEKGRDTEGSMGPMDIFHPNDIDILKSDIAHMFPMFEAGDLLISIRNRNLVAVMDPDNYRIKWKRKGPWTGQHDPDFIADGKISVYDNNTGYKRSEVLTIDPSTNEVSSPLLNGNATFYSPFMGKHQYIPNGNILIVVPAEGRIIEVSPDGNYVMEFNNISADAPDYNEHVSNGTWIPPNFFVAPLNCSDQ